MLQFKGTSHLQTSCFVQEDWPFNNRGQTENEIKGKTQNWRFGFQISKFWTWLSSETTNKNAWRKHCQVSKGRLAVTLQLQASDLKSNYCCPALKIQFLTPGNFVYIYIYQKPLILSYSWTFCMLHLWISSWWKWKTTAWIQHSSSDCQSYSTTQRSKCHSWPGLQPLTQPSCFLLVAVYAHTDHTHTPVCVSVGAVLPSALKHSKQ